MNGTIAGIIYASGWFGALFAFIEFDRRHPPEERCWICCVLAGLCWPLLLPAMLVACIFRFALRPWQ